MDDESKRKQWGREADRISEQDKESTTGIDIPRDEMIRSRPLSDYALPDFLRRTCIGDQFNTLTCLLAELRDINEQFVGENCRETEAYIALTQQDRVLREKLRKWSADYVSNRLSQQNPKDQQDPFETFHRLMIEFDQIAVKICNLPNTVNYLYLDEVLSYARWMIYDGTWKHKLIWQGDHYQITFKPIRSEALEQVATLLSTEGWEHHRLLTFAKCLFQAFDNEAKRTLTIVQVDQYQEELAAIVEMILEMRPFLIGSSSENLAIPLPNGHSLVWNWVIRYGIANVWYAESEREAVEIARLRQGRAIAICNFDGVFVDPTMPWLSLHDFNSELKDELFAINLYVLRQFFDKFYEFFKQIDFEKIRRVAQKKPASESVGDDEFAVACSDMNLLEQVSVAQEEAPIELRTKFRIRPIKLSVMLRVLEKDFGCTIRQGKGSEISVHRPSGRIWTFGTHHPTVLPFIVSQALARMNIARSEWVSAAYKSKNASERS